MSDVAARVRGLAVLSVSAGIAVIGLYVVFVRLPIGQRWDDRALLGGLRASEEARKALTAALHGIRISTLILMVAVILVIGLARRRLLVALVATAAFAGAIVNWPRPSREGPDVQRPCGASLSSEVLRKT